MIKVLFHTLSLPIIFNFLKTTELLRITNVIEKTLFSHALPPFVKAKKSENLHLIVYFLASCS
nr:MAG TPA: hypothetical protein [Caudoviricetes sp.]